MSVNLISSTLQKGAYMPRQTARHTTQRDINAAQRSQMALQLRAQGLNLRDIAKQCGFADKSGAYRAIGRELDRQTAEDVNKLRDMETLRLDELLQTFAPKARGGDVQAARVVLETIQTRCKILGLNIADREVPAQTKVIVRMIPSNYLGLTEEELAQQQAVNSN